MTSITKIDLACDDPSQVAEFLTAVLRVAVNDLDGACYSADLDGVTLFLCPKTLAGVDGSGAGTHQIHLRALAPVEHVRREAKARGLETAEFDGERGPAVAVWDPEGNPWILEDIAS